MASPTQITVGIGSDESDEAEAVAPHAGSVIGNVVLSIVFVAACSCVVAVRATFAERALGKALDLRRAAAWARFRGTVSICALGPCVAAAVEFRTGRLRLFFASEKAAVGNRSSRGCAERTLTPAEEWIGTGCRDEVASAAAVRCLRRCPHRSRSLVLLLRWRQ
jgi:hypothetical protein